MAGPWTNYPNGITSMGVPVLGPGALLPYTGNYFFVDYTNGLDGNAGTASRPLKTLEEAHERCTANNNDVVFFSGTMRPRDGTTIVWSKAQTHLVGLCAPVRRGKRARISPASGTTAYNILFSVTGAGCMFANFGTFYGFNSASALVCWSDTGGRSSYYNVEFLGFGDGTASTGTANQTGARAFSMNTDVGESTFVDCVFGVDTVTRNAANYTVAFAGGAPRITMENCDFEAYLGASGAGSSHLLIGASGIDRYLNLKNCRFMNSSGSGATTMTQALNVSGSAGGMVLLNNCTGYGFTDWETSASGRVLTNNSAVDAVDGGIAEVVAPS